MDELLDTLFAAAIYFSALPAIATRPPTEALPFPLMLQAVCADLKVEPAAARTPDPWCLGRGVLMAGSCGAPPAEAPEYEQCTHQRGLVAAYLIGQHRIVYRNDLDLNNDLDNSFLVHEYVHALQRRHYGERLFSSCAGVWRAEKQAYAAQQRYLNARGQLLRVGDPLRYFRCSETE